MSGSIREQIEQREREVLSPYACCAASSTGRDIDVAPDPVRTCFQRDRDRILHSKPFRRLKHKTQVFIDPNGDHYRTRLTHTLEVSQIARTIGRALWLNEDLIEAIALGHDAGHPPFGHAGEDALDAALATVEELGLEGPTQFRHYDQSLRVLQVLEGLNLTHEVQAGIGGHSKGVADLSEVDGDQVSTLEAAVVRIADRVAYLNHDLDDALRSGMIDMVPRPFEWLGQTHGERVGSMVEDVIFHSKDSPAIRMSPKMLASLNDLKDWLFENVYYLYPKRYPAVIKAKSLVFELFLYFSEPGTLPPGYTGIQGAVDYIAGMTDRYAIDVFRALRLPEKWPG